MGVWNDEFDGIGGSYLLVDGKRVPVQQKDETPPVVATPEPTDEE
jgi:hypothetical protein